MAAMLRTKEMAAKLGISEASLNQAGNLYGAPCFKFFFLPRNGRGKKQTGWDPDDVIAWYKGTARMDDHGSIVNLRTGQLRRSKGRGVKHGRARQPGLAPKASEPPVALAVTPGMVMMGLVHLLGAFAFACEHGGIPHSLQELFEAADIEKMSPVALEIIEEMALRHPKTEAQWMLIKPALAVLTGRAKAGAPGDNGLPIKITIQAGPNLADKIDLKVIGYNTPDPERRTANERE